MTLETAVEIAVAIALPLWLVMEQFLGAHRASQRSGGHLEAARPSGASVQPFRVDNSTGPALRRRAA
jgi:hypothetical protein